MHHVFRRRRRTLLTLATAALLLPVALAAAPAANAQVLGSTLVLGPVTVGPDGLVTVTGTVGGSSLADATVTVNGQSFPVIEGRFTAQVRVLTDQNLLEIRLGDDVIRIPLNLDLPGLSDPLQLLRDAGLTLLIPPGGLQIVDGLPLVIQGRLLDRSTVAEFKIAGVDVLSLLGPDGSFSVPIPGSPETVDVSITDTRGVSQTSTFAVAHVVQTPWGNVRCTIVGTAGNDVLSGTAGRDVICGLAGNDRINGRGGNDDLVGGGGRDSMAGSLGRDRIHGGGGNDRASGGPGADRFWGSTGGDRLAGGAARDRLDGGRGNDRVLGGAGNDRLLGGLGRDRLAGGTGRDFLAAKDGRRDVLFGGAGRDAGRFDRFDRSLAVERRV